jgi:hypothetical protein
VPLHNPPQGERRTVYGKRHLDCRSGFPPPDLAAAETSSTIYQSSSVISVSMAGLLSPDTHRFEEMVIREYPYPMFAAIRPHDLTRKIHEGWREAFAGLG